MAIDSLVETAPRSHELHENFCSAIDILKTIVLALYFHRLNICLILVGSKLQGIKYEYLSGLVNRMLVRSELWVLYDFVAVCKHQE